MLLDLFDEDQMSRYEAFRRSNLNKTYVKKASATSYLVLISTFTFLLIFTKIANQVLSQSITPSVATAISGFSKIFASDLIERARKLQAEWGDDEPGAPLTPEHIREAARRWRIEQGKSGGDPVAAMESLNRPKIIGGMGGRLFK